MYSNLPDGCTAAQIDALWGTDAQEASHAEAAANVELVDFCREDLIRTVNKYADQLGLGDDSRQKAADYIQDLIGDVFGEVIIAARNAGVEA